MDNSPNELPLEALADRDVGIKLIGVGGGGSNAVDRLKMENLDRLQLAVINTDFKAISTSPVQDKAGLKGTPPPARGGKSPPRPGPPPGAPGGGAPRTRPEGPRGPPPKKS